MTGRTARIVTGMALVLGLVTACGGDPSTPAGSTTSGSSATDTSSTTGSGSSTSTGVATETTSGTSTSTTGATLKGVPVYYVAESRGSFKLYREFRTVPDEGGVVVSAVSAMTRLPALDNDYQTPWRPASDVSVVQQGGGITVDLSADAFSNTNVGSELASTALQQLVYTATAAAAQSGTPAGTVTITKDGQAADVWGVERIGSAMKRAPLADVQAQAWVTSPQEGEVRQAGNVPFTGFGTSFEATFGWVIRTPAGADVARGSAMGGTGTGGFGAVSFSAALTPGTYTVTLSTDDASGGAEGGGPATDDKTFTVR